MRVDAGRVTCMCRVTRVYLPTKCMRADAGRVTCICRVTWLICPLADTACCEKSARCASRNSVPISKIDLMEGRPLCVCPPFATSFASKEGSVTRKRERMIMQHLRYDYIQSCKGCELRVVPVLFQVAHGGVGRETSGLATAHPVRHSCDRNAANACTDPTPAGGLNR